MKPLFILAVAAIAFAQDTPKEILPDAVERNAQQDISHRMSKLKEEYTGKENALILEGEILRLRACLRAQVKLEQCGEWTPQGTVQILPPRPEPPKPEPAK